MKQNISEFSFEFGACPLATDADFLLDENTMCKMSDYQSFVIRCVMFPGGEKARALFSSTCVTST